MIIHFFRIPSNEPAFFHGIQSVIASGGSDETSCKDTRRWRPCVETRVGQGGHSITGKKGWSRGSDWLGKVFIQPINPHCGDGHHYYYSFRELCVYNTRL